MHLNIHFSHKRSLPNSVINWIIMEQNIISNALVIHLLFKNEKDFKYHMQIDFFAKFIRLGLLYQSSMATIFIAKNCLLIELFQLFRVFFDALINVYRRINWYDCYIRIKHYANFRVFWTKRVVVKIIFIELLLVLFLAIMLTTDFLLGKEGIGISAYCVIGGLIFSAIISLQVITVQQSNAVHNELIILASQRTNQKITKFCHSSTDHFSSIYVRFMQHRSGSIE